VRLTLVVIQTFRARNDFMAMKKSLKRIVVYAALDLRVSEVDDSVKHGRVLRSPWAHPRIDQLSVQGWIPYPSPPFLLQRNLHFNKNRLAFLKKAAHRCYRMRAPPYLPMVKF